MPASAGESWRRHRERCQHVVVWNSGRPPPLPRRITKKIYSRNALREMRCVAAPAGKV